jgi:hydroxymethylbilane synthase
MKVTIGSRGSKLSLIQTDEVVKELIKKAPHLDFDVKIIKSTADKKSRKPLNTFKEWGIFVKSLNKAVLEGKVDFAVHSMKDVPTELLPKLKIVAVPKRESAHDVLISKNNLKLNELPKKAIIGTGSPRRMAQIYSIRPDLKIKTIRGNVNTRVEKFVQGKFDGLVLAEVGLKRLNLQDYISERFPLDTFTPPPGQGALAVITRVDNHELIENLKQINHQPSMVSILAERTVIKKLAGGCKLPLGVYAKVKDNKLSLYANILSTDGKIKIITSRLGDPSKPENLGLLVAEDLIKKGALNGSENK